MKTNKFTTEEKKQIDKVVKYFELINKYYLDKEGKSCVKVYSESSDIFWITKTFIKINNTTKPKDLYKIVCKDKLDFFNLKEAIYYCVNNSSIESTDQFWEDYDYFEDYEDISIEGILDLEL